MATNQYASAVSAPPPAPGASPQLGYGNQNSASIDTVNQWMRAQPWYQQLLQSFGQNPNNVHLSDAQKTAVVRAAQAHGVIVDEGHNGQEVDDSGNFEAKSSLGKNIAIAAGIAGLALTGVGLAGVGPLAGLAGAGAGTAAAETGGALASTALPVTGALATGAAASGAVQAALTAAGVAGAAAPVAGGVGAATSPSWLSPILSSIVPTAGTIIGSALQAKAAKDASATQAQGLQAALDFEKQQYGDLTGRLAPFIAAGTSSTDRMSQLLGLPARPGTTATAPPTRGPAVGAPPPPAPVPPNSGAPPAQAPPVTLRAPDGTVRQFPADQAQRILQITDAKGQRAQVVNG